MQLLQGSKKTASRGKKRQRCSRTYRAHSRRLSRGATETATSALPKASPGEIIEWGLQLDNQKSTEHECADLRERCGMARYVSLDGQELNNRPWASYFGNPELRIYNAIEPLLFQPREGGGWGSACPVLEDRITGNILELCLEEWRDFVSSEWRYQHIAECKVAHSGFEHNVDKIVLPLGNTAEFIGPFGEPVENLSGAEGFETWVGRSRLEELVRLDNEPFTEKAELEPDQDLRPNEPELGYGCGRASSTNPAEWALIGVSNGIEEWGGAEEQARDQRLLPGAISQRSSNPSRSRSRPTRRPYSRTQKRRWTGTVNPFGFPTKYVVQYGAAAVEEHTTAETTLESTGTSPVGTRHLALTGAVARAGLSLPRRGVPLRTWQRKAHRHQLWPGRELQHHRCALCRREHHWTGLLAPEARTAGSLDERLQHLQREKGLQRIAGLQRSTESHVRLGEQRAGLTSWGAEGKLEGTPHGFGEGNAFIGTDEPPNATQIAHIEAEETTPTTESLLTIPVAQESIAIVVDLPSGCSATSTPAPGRLELSDASLQGIFAGTLKTWGHLVEENPGDAITGAGCAAAPIVPVVREDQSGTTHILKRFLGLISTASLATTQGSETWNELSEGKLNTAWPTAAAVKTAGGTGGTAEAHTVLTTPGSIGYVNLAEARTSGFAPATTTTFWVELQDRDKPNLHADAEPSTNGDVAQAADANCAKTDYLVGNGATETFPPPDAASPWNRSDCGAGIKDLRTLRAHL